MKCYPRGALIPCLWIAIVIIGALDLKAQAPAPPSGPPAGFPKTCYLYTYFMGNGDDGLHLAWSRDGFKWDLLNGGKSYLKPGDVGEKLIRDPCLLLGPDGVFRLVWTDGWNGRTIGYASSKDLLTWSEQKALPVMDQEPTARNSWTPEVHYDAANQKYLILWASLVPGQNPADDRNRFYLTTTKDFVTYTPTTLFFDPGFNALDPTILAAKDKFYLIFRRDEDKPQLQKNLWLASGDKMTGPFGSPTGPLATNPDQWLSVPSAIKIGDDYIIYYDFFGEHRFGGIRSKDMQTWEDITPQLSMPDGGQRGTVLEVPSDVVIKLLEAAATPGTNPDFGANSATPVPTFTPAPKP